MSGLAAVQGHDGGKYSYLELAEFIEAESPQAKEDLRELWTRVLFSCAIGNTDNHLRNHGFLRRKKAKMQAMQMACVLTGWQKLARTQGISESSIAYMAESFESGIEKLRIFAS